MAAIPATLIGWMLGGRLVSLGQLRFRSFWMIVVGLAAQVVVIRSVGRDWGWEAQLHPALIFGAYLLILAGLWRNRQIPGMLLVFLGFTFNFVTIAANGGAMPVTYKVLQDSGQAYLVNGPQSGQYVSRSKDILLTRDEARLWPLTDVLITPPPVRRAISVGDLMTLAGIGLVWVGAMRRQEEPAAVPEEAPLAA